MSDSRAENKLGSLASWGAIALIAAAVTSACGAGGGKPETQPEMRSPSHDYKDPPRSGDGEVLGADRQAPADWLQAGVTNEHPAYKQHKEPEHGAPAAQPSAAPSSTAPAAASVPPAAIK